MARPRRLTETEMLARVHTYVQIHHRLPATRDLPSLGLSYDIVRVAFGGIANLWEAYRGAYTQERETAQAGLVTCLKCGQRWYSPDKRLQHNHPTCNREAMPDGSWMTGSVVRDDWWALFDEDNLDEL